MGRAHDPVHLGQARGGRPVGGVGRRGPRRGWAKKKPSVRDRVQRAPRGGPRLDGGLPREAGQRAVRARGGGSAAAPVRRARPRVRRRGLQRAKNAAAPAAPHRRRRRDRPGAQAGRRGESARAREERDDGIRRARVVGVWTRGDGASNEGLRVGKNQSAFDDTRSKRFVVFARRAVAGWLLRFRRRRRLRRRLATFHGSSPRGVFRRRAPPGLGGRLRRAHR